MARAIRNENLLIVYSTNFLFFEWKLEESDLRGGNAIRSSEFNLGNTGKENSFLEIRIASDGTVRFYLHKPIENGYYVLTILDKNKAHIKSIHNTIGNFDTTNMIDLFGTYRNLPSSTEYPVIVTCTAKSSNNDFFSMPNANHENRMSEISSDLIRVLKEDLNTDVELRTPEENIKAHKIILQARSPVFYKMFSHDSSEVAENAVTISDIGSATIKRLVDFLYSGKMENCNFEEAMELYYAADKYEVMSLRDDCRAELLNNLDVDNACSLFTLANRHNDKDLKDGVVQFASVNLTSIVNTESINDMSKDDVILLMRLCVPGMKKQ